MKISDIKKRLKKTRPIITITIRIPKDVLDDLKRLSPVLGFTGYQPLVRYYLGKGLREDVERLETPPVELLVENLKRHGVNLSIIQEALIETKKQAFG